MMTNSGMLKLEIAALRAQLERLERKAAAEPSINYDAMPEGTVLKFGKRFGSATNKTYTYVALKRAGQWYLSSEGGKSAADFEAFMGTGVSSVDIASFSPFAGGGVIRRASWL